MACLRAAALVLAAYLAGVALFLLILYTWLALDPRRSPRARPVRAFLGELGWAAATEWTVPFAFFLWPRWWRRPRPKRSRGSTDRTGPQEGAPSSATPPLPVLMVHGWGQNRADFWGLAWRLRLQGVHPLHAFDYFFFGPVERSARRLAREVDRVLAAHGAARLHLVCHSLGGLVARHFVERAGGADRVASVTFLGSPLVGTHRASTGIGWSARQMRPGSPALLALGPPAPPTGVRYFSVWSHSDAMVVPASSARLQGRGEELELRDAGHLGLLYRPEVARQVGAWLAQAEGR